MTDAVQESITETDTELTDHDVLLQLVCLALKDEDMTAADVLERVEELGRSNLVEEAREMNLILEDAEDEDDGDPLDGDPEEDE